MCALISALLSIGCVSDAIMVIDNPLRLILALQRAIIASAQAPGNPVALGEVASALSELIVHPPRIPFFRADQDPTDDLSLVIDGLLAQDGVAFHELLFTILGDGDEGAGADGALAPQPPGVESDVPFFRLASTGLLDVLGNLRRGCFAGRIIKRLPRVLTLVIDLSGEEDDPGVDLPGAIGVTPADGGDAVQYRLVSVVVQHLGPRVHYTSQTVDSVSDETLIWRIRNDNVNYLEDGDAFGGFAGRGRIAFYVREFILEDECGRADAA